MARNRWVKGAFLSVTVAVIAGWLYQFQDALRPLSLGVNRLSPSSIPSSDAQQLALEVAPDLSTAHPDSVEIDGSQEVRRPPFRFAPLDPSLALNLYHVVYQGRTIEEVERGEQFSRLESEMTTGGPIDSPFEESVFEGDFASEMRHYANLVYISELACLRNFGHYFVLAEEDGPGFFVFFTNDENTPIRTLLGDQYSAIAQRHFDARGYLRAVHRGTGGVNCLRGNPRDPSSLTRAQ